MLDFAKTLGQGLLYLILSPFIVAGVLLYGVYCIFLFLFMFIKRMVMFFKGEDMKASMRYDKVAKAHLQSQDEKEEDIDSSTQSPVIQKETTHVEKTTIVQQNQPIIIQTDEEGRLKGVSYIQPTTQTFEEKDIVEEEKVEEAPLLEEIEEDLEQNFDLNQDNKDDDNNNYLEEVE